MKPIINTAMNIFLKAVSEYLVKLPKMNDAKFNKVVQRVSKLSTASAPTFSAIAEGVTRGATKELKGKL